MVQRTGRTGRNRDGRVVCLVSKGPEERRLEKLEEDKKRVWNALKRPNFFKFSLPVPLLPNVPYLERKVLNSSSKSCRLSQIGGYDHRKPSRKRIRTSLARTIDDESWILTSVQERDREEQFGDFQYLEKSKRRKLYARFWQELVMLKRNDSTLEGIGGLGMKKYLIKMEEKVSHLKNNNSDNNGNIHIQRSHWSRSMINIFKVRTHEGSATVWNEEIPVTDSPTCDLLQSTMFLHAAASPSKNSTYQCNLEYDDHCFNFNLNDSSDLRRGVSFDQNILKPNASSQHGNYKLSATDVFPSSKHTAVVKETANNYIEPDLSATGASISKKHSPVQQAIDFDDREYGNSASTALNEKCLEKQEYSRNYEEHRNQLIDAMIESVNIVLSAQDSSSESDESTVGHEIPCTGLLDTYHECNFEGLIDNVDLAPMNAKVNATKKVKIRRFIESQSPHFHADNVSAPSKRAPTATQWLVDTPLQDIKGNDIKADDIKRGRAWNHPKWRSTKYTSDGMKYLDLEALEDGDGIDDDDEEEDCDDSFDYEDSFINNSSQLGYTQGGLADETEILSKGKAPVMSLDVHMYRQVDNARIIKELFDTPILAKRKRLAAKRSRHQPGCTQDLEGFSSMPFIRTVLEHHRQGGNADDLERCYQDFSQDSL